MNPPPAATAPSVMPGWAIGLLVFFIFALLIGGGVTWYCYRRQKAEVKEMLDDYRALSESYSTNVFSYVSTTHLAPPFSGKWRG